MPERQNSVPRNPLHPKALRTTDLTVGRRIIEFNLKLGILDEATVMSLPFEGHLGPAGESNKEGLKTLVVTLEFEFGAVSNASLLDMGVAPYPDSSWSRRNFTIDANDRHLLPEADPTIEPTFLERLIIRGALEL